MSVEQKKKNKKFDIRQTERICDRYMLLGKYQVS